VKDGMTTETFDKLSNSETAGASGFGPGTMDLLRQIAEFPDESTEADIETVLFMVGFADRLDWGSSKESAESREEYYWELVESVPIPEEVLSDEAIQKFRRSKVTILKRAMNSFIKNHWRDPFTEAEAAELDPEFEPRRIMFKSMWISALYKSMGLDLRKFYNRTYRRVDSPSICLGGLVTPDNFHMCLKYPDSKFLISVIDRYEWISEMIGSFGRNMYRLYIFDLLIYLQFKSEKQKEGVISELAMAA